MQPDDTSLLTTLGVEAFSICFLTELDRDSYPAVLALIAEFIGPVAKRMREPLRKPTATDDGGRDHVQV